MLQTVEDIKRLIKSDEQLMLILSQVQTLCLPDCWICAGILRTRVWDYQSGFITKTPARDVDVVYFDPNHLDYDFEQKLQHDLSVENPSVKWEVKNEARMHTHNPGTEPYTSTIDAIAKFPETLTAIGARLDSNDQIVLAAPLGVSDLVGMIVRPTPFCAESEERLIIYRKRISTKSWQKRWPMLRFIEA